MKVAEQVQQYVAKLPQPLQAEVLDFAEYLLSKVERESEEEANWSALSLASAMRGMESEGDPVYTTADLRVVFG
jgi:hypothetical protein